MNIQIVTKPAFLAVGLLRRGTADSAAFGQLWNTWGARMDEIQHVVQPTVCFGLMDHYDEGTGEFDYLAACAVDSKGDVPAGMTLWEVPAQTYAVIAATLPTIGAAFDAICQQWLPASGYRHTMGPEFEFYDERFDPNDPNSELFIYIPVEK